MNFRQRAWTESRLETLKELTNKELYAMRLLRAVRWLKMRKMKQLKIIGLVCFVTAGCSSVVVEKPVVSVRPLPPELPQNKVAMATAPRVRMLTWTKEEASYRVYTGPKRGQWTTNFVVLTNEVKHNSQLHYGVAGIWNGLEGPMSYWPSNRVAELRAVGPGHNQLLLRYTNNPVAPSQFWTIPQGAKIVDITVGYN